MIDARSMDKRQSGVGNYVSNLIQGLKSANKKHRYAVMVTFKQAAVLPDYFKEFEIYTVPFSSENHVMGDPWEFILLPRLLRNNAIDIFHGPAFMAPPFHRGFQSVATIHDLVAFHHPHTIPMKYAFYMRFLIKLMVSRAGGVITDSEFIRNEIIKMFHVDEKKVFAIPIAASEMFKPVEDKSRIEKLKELYGINKRYFLHVGNIEPRKNLINLFRACDRIWERLGPDFQLVVVGKKGWLYKEIFDTLSGTKCAHDVVFTGYVYEEDIPALYSGADFFIFPSIYEGFGLPILEAMRCGTPVITSNVSSMPEVAGDAALYVDPRKTEDIAEKILELAYNKTLREKMREKGFQQAAKFSWEKTARKILNVYEKVG